MTIDHRRRGSDEQRYQPARYDDPGTTLRRHECCKRKEQQQQQQLFQVLRMCTRMSGGRCGICCGEGRSSDSEEEGLALERLHLVTTVLFKRRPGCATQRFGSRNPSTTLSRELYSRRKNYSYMMTRIFSVSSARTIWLSVQLHLSQLSTAYSLLTAFSLNYPQLVTAVERRSTPECNVRCIKFRNATDADTLFTVGATCYHLSLYTTTASRSSSSSS